MAGERGGLTIGQAASFAGVTVKTVRHYHRLGLLAEPPRDGAGYRRYGSAELLRLVRARALAEAGVPLADVAELLDANRERFAAALAAVHGELSARLEELTAARDRLPRLADDDRALLPDRACAALARLTELEFTAEYVSAQREGLVLSLALAPEGVDLFLTHLERRLDDAEYVELTKQSWEALSWPPDDPRLEPLAAALSDNLLASRDQLAAPATFLARSDAATRYGLLNQQPVVARLTALVEARLRAVSAR